MHDVQVPNTPEWGEFVKVLFQSTELTCTCKRRTDIHLVHYTGRLSRARYNERHTRPISMANPPLGYIHSSVRRSQNCKGKNRIRSDHSLHQHIHSRKLRKNSVINKLFCYRHRFSIRNCEYITDMLSLNQCF